MPFSHCLCLHRQSFTVLSSERTWCTGGMSVFFPSKYVIKYPAHATSLLPSCRAPSCCWKLVKLLNPFISGAKNQKTKHLCPWRGRGIHTVLHFSSLPVPGRDQRLLYLFTLPGSLEELLCSEIAKFNPMLLLLLLQSIARYLSVIRI